MASASFVKLNASSSPWIGQRSFNQRSGSSSRSPAARVSVIRAGSYSDELVKTAVSFRFVIASELFSVLSFFVFFISF